MADQQDSADGNFDPVLQGTKMTWVDDECERSVKLFRGKTGGIMLIFEKDGKSMSVRLSDTAAFATLKLLMDWLDAKIHPKDPA
jgi:hypothetical protein